MVVVILIKCGVHRTKRFLTAMYTIAVYGDLICHVSIIHSVIITLIQYHLTLDRDARVSMSMDIMSRRKRRPTSDSCGRQEYPTACMVVSLLVRQSTCEVCLDT